MPDDSSYVTSLAHVQAELDRLDLLLGLRVWTIRQAADVQEEPADPAERHDEIVARLEQAGAVIAERIESSLRRGVRLRLVELAETFGLTPFDIDVIVVCLAPEVDRRYHRLYAYLHDDETRPTPTVELVLALRCAELTARHRFSGSAPLVRHRLITLTPDATGTLLGSEIRLEPRVASFLLDSDDPDDRLRPYVRIGDKADEAGEWTGDHRPPPELARLATRAEQVFLYLQGPRGVGKRSAATAACARPLLIVATGRLAEGTADEFGVLTTLIDREARLRGAATYWNDADALLGDDKQAHRALLLDLLTSCRSPVFLAGEQPWYPDGIAFVYVEFPPPGYTDRLRIWQEQGTASDGLEPTELAALAAGFRLTGGQIGDATATARNLARARSPDTPIVTAGDLRAACRLRSNQKLATLAQRITPHYGWDDIVLPADRLEQLHEIANQMRYRGLVYETWGFERTVVRGRGLGVLFAGPSGTGKTMAADVLAYDLGLDLYKIDLSTVVSKFIGETEKNLARIFAEAETSNAILFFDEADALFGKRTQVRDAHDRYANLEISYLLQRMEEHEGMIVLATNLRKNLDDAFVRRLRFTVEFPLPDVADRRRIWDRIWPDAAPRSADLDLDLLARTVDVSGAHIRNIALASAFLAAADGGTVTMEHLLHGTRREYQKMGKVLANDGIS